MITDIHGSLTVNWNCKAFKAARKYALTLDHWGKGAMFLILCGGVRFNEKNFRHGYSVNSIPTSYRSAMPEPDLHPERRP